MEPRIQLPKSKIAASATVVSDTDNLFALNQFGVGLAVLQITWLLCQPAYAQGDTGPLGFEGLDDLLILLTVFPFLGVGLSFLIFKATGQAWVFFLAPFFFAGLSFVGPFDLMGTPSPSEPPAFFIKAGLWTYGAHILAIAIVYRIFSRTKKVGYFSSRR